MELDVQKMSYGAKLREYRKEQGMTLAQVEKMTGVSRGTIQNAETNLYLPTQEVVKKLSIFYGELIEPEQKDSNGRTAWRTRTYRQAAGLTVRELAKLSGCSLTTLYRTELGERQHTVRGARNIERATGFAVPFHEDDPRNAVPALMSAEACRKVSQIESTKSEEPIHHVTRMINAAALTGASIVYFDRSRSPAFVENWQENDALTITLQREGYRVTHDSSLVSVEW